MVDQRVSTHNHISADRYTLQHHRTSTEERTVANLDIPCQLNLGCQMNAVTEHAVMPNPDVDADDCQLTDLNRCTQHRVRMDEGPGPNAGAIELHSGRVNDARWGESNRDHFRCQS